MKSAAIVHSGESISYGIITNQKLLEIVHNLELDDAVRNEVCNRLRTLVSLDISKDLLSIAGDSHESPRFRGFALQHLGLYWSKIAANRDFEVAKAIKELVANNPDGPIYREGMMSLALDPLKIEWDFLLTHIDDDLRGKMATKHMDLAIRLSAMLHLDMNRAFITNLASDPSNEYSTVANEMLHKW